MTLLDPARPTTALAPAPTGVAPAPPAPPLRAVLAGLPAPGAVPALDAALADAMPNVHFAGRLATYQYYNMDQVVGQALALWKRMTSARTLTAA